MYFIFIFAKLYIKVKLFLRKISRDSSLNFWRFPPSLTQINYRGVLKFSNAKFKNRNSTSSGRKKKK